MRIGESWRRYAKLRDKLIWQNPLRSLEEPPAAPQEMGGGNDAQFQNQPAGLGSARAILRLLSHVTMKAGWYGPEVA